MARRRGPRVTLVVVAIAAILVGALAVLGWSWWGTYRQAERVQAELASLRASVSAQDWSAAVEQLDAVEAAVADLAQRADSPAWRVAESVPVLGSNATALAYMADAVDAALAAVAPLAPFAERIADVRRPDGSLDLDLVRAAAPLLDRAAESLSMQARRLGGIDVTQLRPQVAEPFLELRDQLGSIASGASVAAELAAHLPALLGADGDRRWLVLLQNPAEIRGTGGFPGGYAIVSAKDGRLRLESVGKSDDLNSTEIPTASAPIDSRMLWGPYLRLWRTFNLSPHFPLTAALAAEGMRVKGQPVDGVIAVDPRTVAALLSVTGPVTADGVTIDADDAEKYFTVDQYARIPDLNERADVSVALVRAALTKIIDGDWDLLALVRAISAPVADGHVRVWSADAEDEEWLATTPVGGVVPDAPGPVVAVALNNAAGNKMDAFLHERIAYRVGACSGSAEQRSSVQISLRNNAPLLLPDSGDYGRADDPDAPEGSTKILVHLYAPVGAQFGGATIDGVAAEVYVGEERNRPVWWRYLELERGQEVTLEVDFVEPTVPGATPSVLTSPLVDDPDVLVRPVAECLGG